MGTVARRASEMAQSTVPPLAGLRPKMEAGPSLHAAAIGGWTLQRGLGSGRAR